MAGVSTISNTASLCSIAVPHDYSKQRKQRRSDVKKFTRLNLFSSRNFSHSYRACSSLQERQGSLVKVPGMEKVEASFVLVPKTAVCLDPFPVGLTVPYKTFPYRELTSSVSFCTNSANSGNLACFPIA